MAKKKKAAKRQKHPKLHAHPTGWFVPVRGSYLPLGWVDTKVAAIDDTWSGLKFLRRKS